MKQREDGVRILARWIYCVHFTYVEAPFAAIQRVISVKAAVVTLLDKVAPSSRRCFRAWSYKPWNESRTYRAKHHDFIQWSKLGTVVYLNEFNKFQQVWISIKCIFCCAQILLHKRFFNKTYTTCNRIFSEKWLIKNYDIISSITKQLRVLDSIIFNLYHERFNVILLLRVKLRTIIK